MFYTLATTHACYSARWRSGTITIVTSFIEFSTNMFGDIESPVGLVTFQQQQDSSTYLVSLAQNVFPACSIDHFRLINKRRSTKDCSSTEDNSLTNDDPMRNEGHWINDGR